MTSRLGTELRRLRLKKGLSLRAIEKETGISNAYLSQLERGIATNPAPAKLQALANYLDTPYLDLLTHAGYWPDGFVANSPPLIASQESPALSSSLPLSGFADLTDEEEDLVSRYAEFLKSLRKPQT